MKLSAIALSIGTSEDHPSGHVLHCDKATYTVLNREAGTVALHPRGGTTQVVDNVEMILEARNRRQLMGMLGRVHVIGPMLHD